MRRKITQEFISEASQIHKGKYNYSKVQYKGSFYKIEIICPIHGIFTQVPNDHLNGNGCQKCGKLKWIVSKTSNTEKFIQKSIKIHGNAYNYNLVKYTHNKQKVIIICPVHGEFRQKPADHINQKQGCPRCRISKGERTIIRFLNEKNILYEYNKSFDNCRNPKTNRKLQFDFYLPSQNILIEFDGEQHFRPTQTRKYSIPIQMVVSTQNRDKIKNDYASANGIQMVRIPYTKISKIPTILSSYVS